MTSLIGGAVHFVARVDAVCIAVIVEGALAAHVAAVDDRLAAGFAAGATVAAEHARTPRRSAAAGTASGYRRTRASARATGTSHARRTGRLLDRLGIPVRRIPAAREGNEGNDGERNQLGVKGHLDAPCGIRRGDFSNVLPRLSPD